MAGTLAPRVDGTGVAAMHRGERPTQPVVILGDEDQMNMVWHQAPRQHLDACRRAVLGQEITIVSVVGVVKEGPRAAVPTLGDVMREAG